MPISSGDSCLGDPEWKIAPLSSDERRADAPYVESILAGTPLTAHWSDVARGAFLTAVERYDATTKGRRCPTARAENVRLAVFLDAWRVARHGRAPRLKTRNMDVR
jgi:hypothetical protein